MADKRRQSMRQSTLSSPKASEDHQSQQTSQNLTPTINTRKSANTPTTQEIISQPNTVKDAVSGKSYLEKTALAVSGKPYATDTLSEILFHITQLKGATLPIQTAIRAVAFILEEQTELKIAESVAKLTITALAPHIAKIQEETTKLMKISEDTGRNPNLDLTPSFAQMQQTIDQIAAQTKDILKPRTSNYKAALMAGVDTESQSKLVNLAAKNAIKDRQVMITLSNDSELAPGKISHSQLVERVKKALKAIIKDGEPDLQIKAINQLRNGNIVMEMMNESEAQRLREDDTKQAFINKLDANATFKDRSYPIVMQFVPISFNPSKRENLANLERENGWKEGSVLTARWIKPPERRTNDQQVAHILATLGDPQTANAILRDGFTIDQLKLQARKNKREPLRCAKCQHYGHFARECISNKDTCAKCAGEHRTSECDDKRLLHCTPCGGEHASWDRVCPSYGEEIAKFNNRYLENTMPYFPTDEAWTHEISPAEQKKCPPLRHNPPQQELNPQPPPHTGNTTGNNQRYHQTTLNMLPRRGGPSGRGRGGPPDNNYSPYGNYNDRHPPSSFQ